MSVVALLAAPTYDAFAKNATSGFHSSATPKASSPTSFSAHTPSAKASATDGFGSKSTATPAQPLTQSTATPVAQPAGVLDTAASRSISQKASDSYDAAKAARNAPPAVVPAGTGYQTQSNSPGYAPQPTPQATYGYQPTAPSSGNFSTGLVSGMLLEKLTHVGDNHTSQREVADLRRQLAEERDRTSDPVELQRIDAGLAQVSPDGLLLPSVASQPRPIVNQQGVPVKSSGSHLWLVLLLLAVVGGVAVWWFFFRNKKDEAVGYVAQNAATKKTQSTADAAYFRPSGRLKLSSVPFALASVGGSDVKDVSGARSITSVGRFDLGSAHVERAYLSGGDVFVERATNPKRPGEQQMRVYTLSDERSPATAEEWAFFLGDENTEAFIGRAQVDVPPSDRSYNRSWSPSDEAIEPVELTETITDAAGSKSVRQHTLMQYARAIGQSGDQTLFEHLYFGRVSDDDGASIQLWIGLDLNDANVEAI